jgi:phage-related protein
MKVKIMTYSSITEELLKQLDQLPLGDQKKVLEFAKALNVVTLKGKPGKDLLKFTGTIDRDSLKAMEEAVEYEGVKTGLNLERVEQEVKNLSVHDQLELIARALNRIKEENSNQNEADFSWDQFYGISKGLWQEDAQEYVNRLREER